MFLTARHSDSPSKSTQDCPPSYSSHKEPQSSLEEPSSAMAKNKPLTSVGKHSSYPLISTASEAGMQNVYTGLATKKLKPCDLWQVIKLLLGLVSP